MPVLVYRLPTSLVGCLVAALASIPPEARAESGSGASGAVVKAAPVNTARSDLAQNVASAKCSNRAAVPTPPFAFTIDGKSVDGKQGVSRADRQRCTDVAAAQADLQIRYDGLNSEARLNVVAAPDAALKGAGVTFRTYANYESFIGRGEIRIFDKDSTTRQTPIAVLPVDHGAARWRVPQNIADQARYVLRVYDAAGRWDETAPRLLDIAAVRGGKWQPDDLSVLYDANKLDVRNIPVSGGAVLVSGRRVPPGSSVTVMGIPVPVDVKGDFAIRQIVAPGEHQIEVAIADQKGVASVFSRSALIPDHDFFYVALADLTAGSQSTKGPMAVLNPDHADQYQDKVFVNGRLAFYLKGKVQGDTLLTASADTRDQPLKNLLTNFDSKDPRYLLRNLDPDKYYPIYGDDSTLIEDAPTRGKFYVRIERGNNSILWGNFKTSITGTDLVRYERGLYGMRAQAKTDDSTRYGERRGQIEAFAAAPGTLGARDAFLGTGGSLYFTSRQNISQGSDRLTIESRDANTGFVMATRALTQNVDYSIDYLQGRVILTSPLASVGANATLVQAGGLSGNMQYLVATYEYAPSLQAVKDKAVGGRGSFWVNDHVQIGVTGYEQTNSAEKIAVGGVDTTIRLTPGSYIKLEAARSNGPGAAEQVSINGGFTFAQVAVAGGQAWARKIEVATDLSEIIRGADGRLAAYWKEKDANFSGPGELTPGRSSTSAGILTTAKLDEHWGEKSKADVKQDEFRKYSAFEQNLSYSFNDYWKATLGVRFDNNNVLTPSASSILNQNGSRTDIAMRLDYASGRDWGVYGYGQITAERTGDRDANNRIGVGTEVRIDEKTKGALEISEGSGGIGGKVGIERKVDDKTSTYLNYGLDPDRTDIIARGGTGILTTGTRQRFSDSFSVFGEERQRTGGGFSGLTHAFGLEFVPAEHWKAGVAIENGRLSDPLQGDMKRTAISPSIGYAITGFSYAGKFEYRHDDLTTIGLTEQVRDVYLMNNSISNKLNSNWRFIGKLNGSYSTSNQGDFYQGNFLQGITGFAYRPVDNDRLNALFKYTYFYDVPSPGQLAILSTSGNFSQASHVLSVDAAYDLNSYVTLGGKYALRTGSLKDNTLDSGWYSSTAQLAIGRLDFHVVKEWDLSAELRVLNAIDAKDVQAGALVGVYRHMGDNFKIGAGYNFTRFSDDLTNLSAKNQGLFVNAIGKF